jgi:hypothetical protein
MRARVHGGLVDDDIALFQYAAQRFARETQRRQHGPFAATDRCRHRHDVEVAGGQRGSVAGEAELIRRRQFLGRHFQRRIGAALQFRDARLVDVETERREPAAEFDRERQPDVTEADDADA